MKTSWLEVKVSSMQYILIIILGLILVPLGSLVLIGGVRKGSAQGLAIGLLLLAVYAVIVWLIWRGLSKSVKYFTAEGIERRDGSLFLWADLSRVIDRINRRRGLWRTEFHFKNGETAWLMWSYVANNDEVSGYVDSLPYEHAKEGV